MNRLPLPASCRMVLFTDLDGTLIDHHTYSPEGARTAVRRLQERHIPIVFCSSKTFAEQVHLQRALAIQHPFILENGSAIAIPQAYFSPDAYEPTGKIENYDLISLAAADFAAVRDVVTALPEAVGFADVADETLEAATGLSGPALERARHRLFTETLLGPVSPARLADWQRILDGLGWTLSRGGRFYTVVAAGVDKGRAVRWLAGQYRQKLTADVRLAAIGDSPNDGAMLGAVDYPCLVRSAQGEWADLRLPNLIRIDAIGPAGFSAAVQLLLGE